MFNKDTKFFEISLNLEIHLEENEGEIPSFHLYRNNGKTVLCHISLIDNQYVRDKWEIPGKMYSLNSSERKALDNFLKTVEKGNTVDNWTMCFMNWNILNKEKAKNVLAYKNPGYLSIKEDPKRK